jgi:sulfatase maturation enzyme AslB (radical SAM superfamily)
LKNSDKINHLKKLSPSLCLAKWLQVTIDLYNGMNHSCHHPDRHPIPTEGLLENPSLLHNTPFKKEKRKEMLEGARPSECEYCWKIEDQSDENISDRHIKSSDDWAYPHLNKIINTPWQEDINPTYVEVMFSNVCNFSCSYCFSDVSSSIQGEMEKFGPYPIHYAGHRMSRTEGIKNKEDNPYVKAFWEWLPKISPTLEYLRITGGEPLLDQNLFILFDYIENNPMKDLTLSVNSNLGVPKNLINNMITKVRELKSSGKIKNFELYTSVDTYGEQAEYIRHGLDFEAYLKNLSDCLKSFRDEQVIIMCTYNILSIPNFGKLLEKILDLKKKGYKLVLDVSYLENPKYLRANIIAPESFEYAKKDLLFLSQNISKDGFSEYEVKKFDRIYRWMTSEYKGDDKDLLREDFYLFIEEYDKRKKTDFIKYFPELENFLTLCKKTHLNRQYFDV